MNSCTSAAAKFDVSRADEYAEQSRIALAGYDACHDLVACMLAASLGTGGAARILVAGAGGTGQEIIAAARLEPGWAYTAVDPSAPMLQLAMANIAAAGLQARTRTVAGTVDDLPMGPDYDAATLIGVLHHVPDDADKRALLESIAVRLAPGAPFVLACNYRHYTDQPLLLAAWRERWRQQGAAPPRCGPSWTRSGTEPYRPSPRPRCLPCWLKRGSIRRCAFFPACSGGPGSCGASHSANMAPTCAGHR